MSTDQPDLPERFDLRSADPLAERVDVLRATFPEAFREGKVDVDALTRSLGDWVDPGPERFGLTWPGKAECMRVIQEPSLGALVPMPDESVDWDTTQNVIIEGENLEVLKLLQKAYYGKVKMIYIDPPYNTGKEFIYPDNFREGLADYLKYSGQVDDAGFRTSANTETDGRFHSKWLSMMYPRLFLARNLLRDDGVVFASIDDHELPHLTTVMSEIFGEENFVATFIWEKRTTRENRRAFSFSHDYIVCYTRNKELFEATRGLLPLSDEVDQRYANPDNDPRGEWQSVSLNAQAGHATKAQFYTIVTPGGRALDPPPGRCWSVTESRLRELIADGRIWFGREGVNVPRLKSFRSEARVGLTPHTLWRASEVGTNDSARKALTELLDSEAVFDTPKPVELLTRIVQIAAPAGNDLVLDFFAGSGTLAEAMLRAIQDDGILRRFLLVQLPEVITSSRYKSIAALLRDRVIRAEEKLKKNPSLTSTSTRGGSYGFRYFKLTGSNFSSWEGSLSGVDELAEQLRLSVDRATGDHASHAAFEVLLKVGFPLTTAIDEVELPGGLSAYSVDDGALLIFLSGTLTAAVLEKMIARTPTMIIVAESSFSSDEAKVNALQAVRAHNRREESDLTLRIV